MIFGLVLLAVLPALVHPDPAPGLTRKKDPSRSLECAWVSAEVASRTMPGEVRPVRPRGEYVERDALVCEQRLMRPGLREARDEAVLAELDGLTTELATTAGDLHPELADHTWLVEAHYPSPQVAAKLTFATKDVLVRRGLAVSDRAPILSANDLEILTRLAPDEAYEAACVRYAQNGSVRPDDALLAVVSRDARETILHAGLCVDGRWSWLR